MPMYSWRQSPPQEVQFGQRAHEREMEVEMDLLRSGTCEGLPKTPLLDKKGKLINAWKGNKRQMCPGNRGQGRNYPRTAGDRESAVQAKPGEVRARQGLSPSVGDGAQIPAQSRNPCTNSYIYGSQFSGDRQWWQRTCKDAKTNVGVRNDCRNPHRVAADSFPSFPELNYSWKPGKIPVGFGCSISEQGTCRQWCEVFNLPSSSKRGGEENLSLLEWRIGLKPSRTP